MVLPRLLLEKKIYMYIIWYYTLHIYNITDTKHFNKIDTNLLVRDFLLYPENL